MLLLMKELEQPRAMLSSFSIPLSNLYSRARSIVGKERPHNNACR